MKKSTKVSIIVFIAFLSLALVIFFLYPRNPGHVTLYTYEIINSYPHDSDAFTEGLVYENGYLYEGTGLNGSSSVRKVELETGEVLDRYDLPDEFFGEGITILNDKIYQLSYQTHVGFVYDRKTLKIQDGFSYPTEGWGFTHNGKYLIMSDGTPALYFLNPDSFEQVSKVNVYYNDSLLWNLNELEYIDGKVYANIWKTEQIAIINPKTGLVTGIIDLTGLLSSLGRTGSIDVMNGIAYDKKEKRLFVTGKFWPKLFEINLVPIQQ